MNTSPDREQWECPKCGKVMHHRKCRGHSKRDGVHCGDWAAKGSDVCRRHGAAAPQVKAAAQRRLAEAKAEKALATYGTPVEVEPHAALMKVLHLTAGHVEWLATLIAGLDHGEEETDDGRRLRSGLRQFSHGKGAWETSVWVDMYRDERRLLAQVAKDCISAGIEERRVRVAEQQAELIAKAFREFAVALGHDLTDPRVHAAFRGSLELVAGEAA